MLSKAGFASQSSLITTWDTNSSCLIMEGEKCAAVSHPARHVIHSDTVSGPNSGVFKDFSPAFMVGASSLSKNISYPFALCPSNTRLVIGRSDVLHAGTTMPSTHKTGERVGSSDIAMWLSHVGWDKRHELDDSE